MTKGKAFGLCLGAIMLIFILMFFAGIAKDKLEVIPVSECLTGIGALAGIYIGGSIAASGVKGKWWNQQMFDSLNGNGKEGGEGESQGVC